MYRYGIEQHGLPVYAAEGVEKLLKVLVAGSFGDAFAWHTVHDGERVNIDGTALRFSRTDHPPPPVAVEIPHPEKRLVYRPTPARSGA
jgi:hypothetical protein